MTRIAKLIESLDKVHDLMIKRAEADAFMVRAGKRLPETARPLYTHIVAHQAESKKLLEEIEFQLQYQLALERAGIKLANVERRYGLTMRGGYYISSVYTKDGQLRSIARVQMPAHMLAK